MTGTLAVLRQALHRLVDETNVLLVDVEAQQTQSSSGTAANTVQELERLTHQVVVVLVILVAQKVLKFQIKHTVLLQQLAKPKLTPKVLILAFPSGNMKDICLLWVKGYR